MFLQGLNQLGKGDWRGISRHFVQTRTPTQVASHAQKYFIRQQNTQKRKRRSSLFDIEQGPAGSIQNEEQAGMSNDNNNNNNNHNNNRNNNNNKEGSTNQSQQQQQSASNLTKLLMKDSPVGNNNNNNNNKMVLDSREEESMRTLANLVMTHDEREQKTNNINANSTAQVGTMRGQQQKQKHKPNLTPTQQQQQLQQQQQQYSSGHPIAGQYLGAQSPPQTIPMANPFYYNAGAMFPTPNLMPFAASPNEIGMFPHMMTDTLYQQPPAMNMNDLMAALQRNTAAYQHSQQMAMASAMAAGIHPSMFSAQYNMMLPSANTMGGMNRSASADTLSQDDTMTKFGVPTATDSFASFQQQRPKESSPEASASAGLYRPVAGYPSRTETWSILPQQVAMPVSKN